MGVVLDLLRKGVSQTREPAHRHSHGEVLVLYVSGWAQAITLNQHVENLGALLEAQPVHAEHYT